MKAAIGPRVSVRAPAGALPSAWVTAVTAPCAAEQLASCCRRRVPWRRCLERAAWRGVQVVGAGAALEARCEVV